MKLSNRELLSNMQQLKVLAQRDLPIKVSYAIAKNMRKIEDELKPYEEERQRLLEKHGKKDNEGELITNKQGQVDFKNKKAWDKDISELLDIEVDITFHKFNIKHLEGREISPGELIALEHMIEE